MYPCFSDLMAMSAYNQQLLVLCGLVYALRQVYVDPRSMKCVRVLQMP